MDVTDELTVLVWAPRGRDAQLAAGILQRNGLVAIACESVHDIARHVADAGCAVVTEEALQPEKRDVLTAAFAQQPAWSDFPMVLFAPKSAGGVNDAMRVGSVLGNVTVLERPVQSRTLVSAVASALRGRRRQYEARAAIRQRDEFLAMLGHELRNPLAAIVLAIDALHQECGDLGSRPQAILQRQSHHLARLVEDLLDVARITTGKVTLKRAPLDLRELLARSVQNAEAAAGSRSIELAFDAPERAVVDGDPVRLEEVFANILSNAIKYSPERTRVDVVLRASESSCTVDVRDAGIGIAPEMLPHVFDLFAQADASLDRAQGGLGIGLTVVKSLVELHRGSVIVTSPGKGRGSTFRVELPLAHGEVPQERPDSGTHPIVNLKVLVVEDNPDLRELTCDALATVGWDVQSAADGVTGLQMMIDQAFDLAIVDIGLPGLDGYEIARRIRERGSTPRLVAMSGYGQEQDRERALEAGFDVHLTKPVSLKAVLRASRR